MLRHCLVLAGWLIAFLLCPVSLVRADLVEGSASISGRVYIDLDNNGVRSPWEQGIAGVEIWLRFTAGDLSHQMTWTDSDGLFSFGNLPVYYGSDLVAYTLWEIQPDAFIDGKESIVDPWGTTVLDSDSGDRFNTIYLTDFDESPAKGYQFGEWGLKPGHISKAHFVVHTPEPAVLILIAPAAAALLGRRRRRTWNS